MIGIESGFENFWKTSGVEVSEDFKDLFE